MNNLFTMQLISEFYLFFAILYLLVFIIFVQYNHKLNYPNIYNSVLVFAIIILLNYLLINFSLFEIFNLDTIEYKIDTGNFTLKLILTMLTIIYLIYSKDTIGVLQVKYSEHVWLIITSLFSLCVLIITNDFILLLIVLEIQSIIAYVLTSIIKTKNIAIQAAIKYYILNSFAAMLLLFSFSLIYGMFGVHNFVELKMILEQNTETYINNNVLLVSFALITVAFLFKLYAAPFHFWVSDVYHGTTLFVASFFSTITTLPVYYLFAKIYLLYFSIFNQKFDNYLFFFGVISMVVAFSGAIYQKNIKRIIAYSSINSTGYYLISISQQDPFALENIFLYLILYTINLTGVCVILNTFFFGKKNTMLEQIQNINNLYSTNVLYAILLMLLIFSIAGIPFFSIFVSKAILLINIIDNYNTNLIYLVILLAIVSSLFYLNIIKHTFYYRKKNIKYSMPISYYNAVLVCIISIFNILYFFYISYFSLVTEAIMLSIF